MKLPVNSEGLTAQQCNRSWWEMNPMTYDWADTLTATRGTPMWYEEIDRRFLSSAYYAAAAGHPFGRFLAKLNVANKDVLEIGCGMGTHAALLINAGARYRAVDLTDAATQATRHRLDLCRLVGEVLRGDSEVLPFADASFDAVWTWGVIHHSSNTERCLAEISRVLKPGGRLMVMVYYRPSIVYYVHCALIRGILLGRLKHHSLQQIYVESIDGFYARTFTKTELRKMLMANYEDLTISIVGQKSELFPIPRSPFKSFLEQHTPNWLAHSMLCRWGSMIVVEAARKPS